MNDPSTVFNPTEAQSIFDGFLAARRAAHGDLRMEVDAAATEPTADQATTDQSATDTTEIDWKAKAREWEKRAKENKSAADRLAEIEEANKTEAQKTADRLAAAEKVAADARQEALRLRIATRYGIGDEDADLFLTGSDEDTLTKQAERLAGRAQERKKHGNHVPREGDATPPPGDDPLRDFARGVFGPAQA